jgi:hypothetical protein
VDSSSDVSLCGSIYLPKNVLSSVFCLPAGPVRFGVLWEQKWMLDAEYQKKTRVSISGRYASPYHHPKDAFYSEASPEPLKR